MKTPAWKKFLFAVTTVALLFAMVEFALLAAGVRPVLYDEDPYVGFSSHIPLFVEQADPNGRVVMATAENKLQFFNPQRFAAKKSRGTYRIFCAGGSTTFGRPYDDMTSFCGWLREMLPKADPSGKWELINVGGVSYASYRVALLMEELIRYEPDLFIIYSGHNEFLERRTYGRVIGTPAAVRGVGAIMSRTRTYTAVSHAVRALSGSSGAPAGARTSLPGEVETILEGSIGPESYHRDDELRRQVFDHYRYNLMRMVDIARSVGAKIILVTPASNLRGCSPFRSEHREGLALAERRDWQTLLDNASESYAAGRCEQALTAIGDALVIDDRCAEGHYLHGRVLWELGRHAEAKKAFTRAMDEDVCPLRAPTPLVDIVAEVGNCRDVPMVDFVALAAQHSEHGTPGDEFFLDHAHPTIEGNRLLALALLETMARGGIVHPTSTWGDAAIRQVTEELESRLDIEAHGIALRNLSRLFRWAGKFGEGYRLGLRAVQMVPFDAEAHFVVGANAAQLGLAEEAIEHYNRSLEIRPGYARAYGSLGDVLLKQGKLDEAIDRYRRTLKIDPDDSRAYCNLGVATSARGNLDEATAHFRQAIRIDSDYAEAHNSLGTVLVAQGKLDEAAEQFHLALETRPRYSEARYNLASVLRLQGRSDEAIEQFQQTLQASPDYVFAYCGLGSTLEMRGMLDDAAGRYRQAIEIEPNYAEAHAGLADALCSQGKSEEAIAHYRRALRADPNYVRAHCNLGVALASKGDLKEAAECFRRALGIDPFYAEAHNNMASLMLALGQLDGAIEHYREALQAGPNNTQADRPGSTAGSVSSLDPSINRYIHALRPTPDYARVRHNLGHALVMKGDLAGALDHFRQAANLKPDWPLPLNSAARILATHPDPSVRDVGEAVRLAERAAELSGRQNVPVLDTLAMAYASDGRFDRAMATLETAIRLAPASQAGRLREQLERYRQGRF